LPGTPKPIVLITGAAGNIGRSLAAALRDGYSIVGLDQPGKKAEFPLIGVSRLRPPRAWSAGSA
jgi:nucleoside-diphosphate-sugar epimerase